MRTVEFEAIRRSLRFPDVIAVMRDALVAQSLGECDTPMPMHLSVPRENAEVHIKASYRRGGRYFGMKVASTFPNNFRRGCTVGPGVMMLFSAETGEPAALFCDNGYLTDMRTAAVGAMVAKELGRTDETVGIIGTGIQGRRQAQMLAEVLPLSRVFAYDLYPERASAYVEEMKDLLPKVAVVLCESPVEVAGLTRLIVTVTPSRKPHFRLADVQPGTHINAVGADSPGKNEHDPEVLRAASLLLVDSLAQCERLGELQHVPDVKGKAIEIGTFCRRPVPFDRTGITFCDMTGLGVEDLYIAQYCYERTCARQGGDHA